MSAEALRRSGRATKGQHTKKLKGDLPSVKVARTRKLVDSGLENSNDQLVEEIEAEADDDSSIVRCVCGATEDMGGRMMIECEKCQVWQHNVCMGVPEISDETLTYYCEKCRPKQHTELLEALKQGEKIWEVRIAAANKLKRAGKRRSLPLRQSNTRNTTSADDSTRQSIEPLSETRDPTTAKVRLSDKSSGLDLTDNEVGIELDVPTVQEQVAQVINDDDDQKAGDSAKLSELQDEGTRNGGGRTRGFGRGKRRATHTLGGDRITMASKRRKSRVIENEESVETGENDDVLTRLPVDRQRVAETLIRDFQELIEQGIREDKLSLQESEQSVEWIPRRLGIEIEEGLYKKKSRGSGSTYKEQFLSIRYNVKKNWTLLARLVRGEISGVELADMSSDDMASEELQQQVLAMKEENDKQSVIIEDIGRPLRNAHNDEDFTGDGDGVNDSDNKDKVKVCREDEVSVVKERMLELHGLKGIVNKCENGRKKGKVSMDMAKERLTESANSRSTSEGKINKLNGNSSNGSEGMVWSGVEWQRQCCDRKDDVRHGMDEGESIKETMSNLDVESKEVGLIVEGNKGKGVMEGNDGSGGEKEINGNQEMINEQTRDVHQGREFRLENCRGKMTSLRGKESNLCYENSIEGTNGGTLQMEEDGKVNYESYGQDEPVKHTDTVGQVVMRRKLLQGTQCSLNVVCRFVAGGDLRLLFDVDAVVCQPLEISGRVAADVADTYCTRLDPNTMDIMICSVEAFTSTTDQAKWDYVFRYYRDKERWGLCNIEKLRSPVVDIYLIPLGKTDNFPRLFNRLNYNSLNPEPRDNPLLLLAIAARTKDHQTTKSGLQPYELKVHDKRGSHPAAPFLLSRRCGDDENVKSEVGKCEGDGEVEVEVEDNVEVEVENVKHGLSQCVVNNQGCAESCERNRMRNSCGQGTTLSKVCPNSVQVNSSSVKQQDDCDYRDTASHDRVGSVIHGQCGNTCEIHDRIQPSKPSAYLPLPPPPRSPHHHFHQPCSDNTDDEDMVSRILGPMISTPVVSQLSHVLPAMDELQLKNLRCVLDENPQLRCDLTLLDEFLRKNHVSPVLRE